MAEKKAINFASISTGDLMSDAKTEGLISKKFDKYDLGGAVVALNDTISFFKVAVDDRMFSMKLSSTDLGTTGLLDIGFYRLDGRNGIGAAVDADALGNDVDVKAAAVNRSELITIDNIGKRMWELAGLSAKPDYGEFIVAVTVAEASSATAGQIVLEADIVRR